MEITCNSCSKIISLPDEKVPKDKAFSLTCPQCKEKITVPPVGQDNTASPPGSGAQDTASPPQIPETDDDDLDFVEEGTKLALICDQENGQGIQAFIKNSEYQEVVAKSSEDAINRLKFSQFDMIFLNENFSGGSITDNAVLKYIQPMSMTTRRRIFVVLTGNKFRTLDNMQAFANSVNLTLNNKDIPKLDKVIKKAVTDHEMFYKIYRESLRDIKGFDI